MARFEFDDAPRIHPTSGYWYEVRNRHSAEKYLGKLVCKYGDSSEFSAISDAFDDHGMSPPDRKSEELEAFRAGALVTLEAIYDSRLSQQPVGDSNEETTGNGDVLELAKFCFPKVLSELKIAKSIIVNNLFAQFARQALDRHEEFGDVCNALKEVYCQNARPTQISYPELGAGFVLHGWDICWGESVEKVIEQEAADLDEEIAAYLKKFAA